MHLADAYIPIKLTVPDSEIDEIASMRRKSDLYVGSSVAETVLLEAIERQRRPRETQRFRIVTANHPSDRHEPLPLVEYRLK